MESVDGDGGLGTPATAMSLVATSTPPVNRGDHWNEHEHGTPVTPAGNVVEGGAVVTPVTQAVQDPLMHAGTLDPPAVLSPSSIETPPVGTHVHVSIFLISMSFKVDIVMIFNSLKHVRDIRHCCNCLLCHSFY
jgi:hypothetical protein